MFESLDLTWSQLIDIAKNFESKVVAGLQKENQEIQNLPPAEFPLDALTGVTIAFLYTTEEGVEMAGSIIAAASEDKLYRVIFTAPAEIYEFTLQWFNAMYQSFKILPTEELLVQ